MIADELLKNWKMIRDAHIFALTKWTCHKDEDDGF